MGEEGEKVDVELARFLSCRGYVQRSSLQLGRYVSRPVRYVHQEQSVVRDQALWYKDQVSANSLYRDNSETWVGLELLQSLDRNLQMKGDRLSRTVHYNYDDSTADSYRSEMRKEPNSYAVVIARISEP